MEKIWIECQRCGSIFWVFSDELNSIYPKNRIDYQICSSCEEYLNSKKRIKMFDFILDLKDQIGLYFFLLNSFYISVSVRFYF